MGYSFMVLKDVIKGVKLETAELLFRTNSLREPLRTGEQFTYEGKRYKVLITDYDFRYEDFSDGVRLNNTKIYAMELY